LISNSHHFGPFFVFVFRREDFRPTASEGPTELLGYSALLGGAVYLLLWPHAMEPGHFMAICSASAVLSAMVAMRFGLRPAVLFLVVFVLLIPAYSAMFPDQARAQSAILRARDQFGSPEGIALLMAFGCLALAAYRDALEATRAKIGLAMEAGDLCVWDWSRQGLICHPAKWKGRFALPQGPLFLGKGWEEIIHPDDIHVVREGFERLAFSIDCDESLLLRRLPGLILLTLVENAIKHGISRLEAGGTISVQIGRVEGGSAMRVGVVNDGALCTREGGCGLENTLRRISLATQGKGSLTIREISGPRVEVEVVIPLPEDAHPSHNDTTESDPLHVFSEPLNNPLQPNP
jgi:hypothetical protein